MLMLCRFLERYKPLSGILAAAKTRGGRELEMQTLLSANYGAIRPQFL